MFTEENVNSLPMESLLTPAAGRADMAEAPAGGVPVAGEIQSPRDAWFERAKAVMPWGVSSNFRYWGPDDTMVVARGKGAEHAA